MKLRIVPASRGLAWMRQGLQVLKRQPLGFMGLVGMVIGGALLLAGVPLLGPLAVLASMPVMWMGFMLATRRTMLGERVTPGVLIEAVRAPDSPRKTFLQLGGAYIAAIQVMMLLAGLLGPGPQALSDAMEAIDAAEDAASAMVANPVVLEDMLWRMALVLPVSLVFWHTPALVLWARMPVGKALFFSAVATWRNLGAFLIYGLCWLGALLVLGLLDRLVISVLPIPALANALAFCGALGLGAAFYASLYFTTVDCFEATHVATPGATPPGVPTDGQDSD